MIHRPDLHAADPAARAAVQQHLRALRKSERLSAYEVSARLGLAVNAVRDLELKPPQWSVRRVQAWARALNHRFTMTLAGVAVPDGDDLITDLLTAATPFGAADEDRLHLFTVVNNLVRIRESAGITFQDIADRMGVHDRAVRGWEDHPDGSLVKTVQRYARAVGGELILEVTPVSAAVPA